MSTSAGDWTTLVPVTGEAVALDLRVAQFPSRMLALALDLALQLALGQPRLGRRHHRGRVQMRGARGRDLGERDVVERTVRDFLTEDIDEVACDDAATVERMQRMAAHISGRAKRRNRTRSRLWKHFCLGNG